MGNSFAGADERAVVELIAFLRERSRPPPDVRDKKFERFFARVSDAALNIGTTFGESGLWRGTAIRTTKENEFFAYWKSISNDLHRHIELVREGIEALHDVGLLPPPGSVRRLAIILRCAKRVDLEVQLLRAWIEVTPRGNSKAYESLLIRADRAGALVRRALGES